MRVFKFHWILFSFILSGLVTADTVKLSQNFICHDETSPSYHKTKHFIPYQNVEDCVEAGGRVPKSYNSSKAVLTKYSRHKFNHWVDEDGDCINTRHEILLNLSTIPVLFKTTCLIEAGRWKDPYTGQQFTRAKNLDIDHLVPLKWAWEHGANGWTAEKRKVFANDEANLFAVKSSVNNKKGAMGPTLWLPPDTNFHCDYVSQFIVIVESYNLNLTVNEAELLNGIRLQKCVTHL